MGITCRLYPCHACVPMPCICSTEDNDQKLLQGRTRRVLTVALIWQLHWLRPLRTRSSPMALG